jgi:hypothetical protein
MATRLPNAASLPKPTGNSLNGIYTFCVALVASLTAQITEILTFLNVRQPWQLAIYAVAALPDAAEWTGSLIYVSDETGGATVAFSDGTDWRRVQDRAIVS